jgi:hypothetical protein
MYIAITAKEIYTTSNHQFSSSDLTSVFADAVVEEVLTVVALVASPSKVETNKSTAVKVTSIANIKRQVNLHAFSHNLALAS